MVCLSKCAYSLTIHHSFGHRISSKTRITEVARLGEHKMQSDFRNVEQQDCSEVRHKDTSTEQPKIMPSKEARSSVTQINYLQSAQKRRQMMTRAVSDLMPLMSAGLRLHSLLHHHPMTDDEQQPEASFSGPAKTVGLQKHSKID